jgi:hypothetical protein
LSRIPRSKLQADLRVFISLPMREVTRPARADLPILALKKKRMLEIYEGTVSCVMFDGLKQPWNVGSLDVNVQDGLKKLFQKAFVGV